MTRGQETLISCTAVRDLRRAWFPTIAFAASTAGEAEGGERIQNPEMKKLHDEAARYRLAAKEEKELREKAEERLHSLALRHTFDRLAVQAGVKDMEGAWRLAQEDLRGIHMDDDGAVDEKRVSHVLEMVSQRHPGVVAPAKATEPPQASGRPNNGPRQTDERNLSYLEAKFPALRRRQTTAGPFES